MIDYKDILIDIRKIVRSINLESKRIQKDLGISIPQLLCLSFLQKEENFKATNKQLSEYLNLNSSTVTGIINRLEKKGLIARLPKKGDRRITFVALTSAGYKVLEKRPKLLHDKLTASLTGLAPGKVDEIKASLSVLIDVLGIRDIDASPLLIGEDPNPKE
jgi:DNA-binding MarR family transcriptional regulator